MEYPVYYRVGLFSDDKKATVVCLQEFDEVDYRSSTWLTDFKFKTEQEAKDWATLWNQIHAKHCSTCRCSE